MKPQHIWVVEIKTRVDPGHWYSTAGVGLTKAGANEQLRLWKERDPECEYRITKYEAINDG